MFQKVYAPTHPASMLTDSPAKYVTFAWAGAITPTGVRVIAQTVSDSENVVLVISKSEAFQETIRTPSQKSGAILNRRIVHFEVDELQPGTKYFYRIEVDGNADMDKQGRFETPPASGPFSFRIALASCARTGSNGAVFDTIRSQEPFMFLHLGDFHYQDIKVNRRDLYAEGMEMALYQPAQNALYRAQPVMYVWDDHDYGPNNSDGEAPGKIAAQLNYRQFVPHYTLAAGNKPSPIYQAFTIGRVRFIVTDSRSERTSRRLPDNAQKTILGAKQKAWLKAELKAAKGNYGAVVWVSTMPWIAEVKNKKDHWGGYATERAELANFIADLGLDNLLMLSGDAHMLAFDDGSNSNYSNKQGKGFPVFHAAALDRKGSEKGGPYSHGSFPGGGQFGLVDFEDNGEEIKITITGKDWEDKTIVTSTFTF
jgi:phosphodiesterase/alkaline phosphatase D-like protein